MPEAPGRRGPLLIVQSSDEWYGADRMVAELAGVAAELVGDDLEVWVPDDGDRPGTTLSQVLAQRGVRVRRLPLPILRRKSLTPHGLVELAGQTWRLRRTLAAVDPSSVVAATTAVLPVLWAAPRGSRALLYAQEIWQSRERVVLGLLAWPADAVMAISQPVAAALPGRLRRRTTVVTNAIADSGIPPVPAPADGPVTFVVASRWNSWKGHEFLLRAWQQAGCPGRLVVLGGPPEAGIGVDVPALVAALSRPDSVEIVGEVDDITAWLDRSDVLVLPSTNPEPFGLVVIEAFARARPVIATDHGAPATVVAPDAGWLVGPVDVAGLAGVLAGVTKAEARRRGAAARLLFERQYSIEAWRTSVRGLLGRLADRGEPAGQGGRPR